MSNFVNDDGDHFLNNVTWLQYSCNCKSFACHLREYCSQVMIRYLSKLVRSVSSAFVDVVLQHTYEFKKENGQTVKEDVSVDVEDNFVQYHIKNDDNEVWVNNDFNRVSKLPI